jgi:hypothetical protein
LAFVRSLGTVQVSASRWLPTGPRAWRSSSRPGWP